MATGLPVLQVTIAVASACWALGAVSARAQTPVRNPDNNHYYQIVVSARPLAWHEANAAARSASYNGMVGYLATITSVQEETFLESLYRAAKLPGGHGVWLGGYRTPTSAKATVGWQWVTGEPWQYTHWRDGEPNNFDGSENRLCLDGTLAWNDMANDPAHGPGRLQVVTYVIEYGKVAPPTPSKKVGVKPR